MKNRYLWKATLNTEYSNFKILNCTTCERRCHAMNANFSKEYVHIYSIVFWLVPLRDGYSRNTYPEEPHGSGHERSVLNYHIIRGKVIHPFLGSSGNFPWKYVYDIGRVSSSSSPASHYESYVNYTIPFIA